MPELTFVLHAWSVVSVHVLAENGVNLVEVSIHYLSIYSGTYVEVTFLLLYIYIYVYIYIYICIYN